MMNSGHREGAGIEITLRGIREQDLDLFFLEEVFANAAFRDWFLGRIAGWPEALTELVSAERSVHSANGETDLMFVFRDESNRKGCVLIENKVSAGFQPEQLQRYQARKSGLMASGAFAHAFVLLLAPLAYGAGSAAEVDATISYEEVHDWLAMRDDATLGRTQYKLTVIEAAIKRHATGYVPQHDASASDFWLAYSREANSIASELDMAAPGPRTSAGGFLFFGCALPGDLNLCHKLTRGVVDLQLPHLGSDVPRLREMLRPLLGPRMHVEAASSAAAVRIDVPRLETALSFDSQRSNAREGINAARTLYEWATRHGDRLLQIVAELKDGR